MQEAATLLGKTSTLRLTVSNGKVTIQGPVNKATVIAANVPAGNSVVHVVDTVVRYYITEGSRRLDEHQHAAGGCIVTTI